MVESMLSTILGSFFATLFAILTWYIIEKLTKFRKWNKIKKNFKKLYKLLVKKEYYVDLSTDIIDILVNEIGQKHVFKVLKMSTNLVKYGFSFEGNKFSIRAHRGSLTDDLLIEKDRNYFSFKKIGDRSKIYDDFMNFFINQCKEAGINLDLSE